MGRAPAAHYLDIPLQHAPPPRCWRAWAALFAQGSAACWIWCGKLPEAVLRTTFIVGYPGESAAQFEALCRFVEKNRLQHVGVFAYQAEEGTPAAQLSEQVPMPLREERRAALMEIQADISAELFGRPCGARLPVLVDAPIRNGRPAPGRVWLSSGGGRHYLCERPRRAAGRVAALRYCGKCGLRPDGPGLTPGISPKGGSLRGYVRSVSGVRPQPARSWGVETPPSRR